MRKLFLAIAFVTLFPVCALAQSGTAQPIAPIQSTAAETSHIYAGKNLASLSVSWNAATTARYLMIFDGTALPSNGSTTSCNSSWVTGCMAYCTYVTTSGTAPSGFAMGGPFPLSLRFGTVVAMSTGAGCGTLTIDGANDFYNAQVY